MNHPPRTPSRASIQDSKSSDAQHAALSGAAKAFARPAPQQRASGNASLVGNGALAAAATVGSRASSPQDRRYDHVPGPPLVPSSTGGSVQSVRSDMLYAGRVPNLQPSSQQTRHQHSKSPSFQAAAIAASRATPQPHQVTLSSKQSQVARSTAVRKPAAPPKPRALSGQQQIRHQAEDRKRDTNDTPIPATTSLVNLFEQRNNQQQDSSRRPDPIVVISSNDLAIRSPKPIRTSEGGLTSVFHMEVADAKESMPRAKPASPISDSSNDSFASASENATAPASPETAMPQPRNIVASGTAKRQEQQAPAPETRGKATQPVPIGRPSSQSVSAISDLFSPSSASAKSIPAQYNQLYPRGKTPQMTGDQLANAMVASSLASSRIGTPKHEHAPPIPSQRKAHQPFAFSRTPSPTKGMRHTLRKDEANSESSEEDLLHPYGKHKKKRHLRPKHPNKHHEGDRKRWRDAVTERERKRYEGVWAANKGLYCVLTRAEEAMIMRSPESDEARDLQAAMGDQVSNIVTRDIWQRSRLPESTLEVVWDLVDNECVGRLTKDEFVVGMFLIDYCLKGRKLPIKVSESVWASVRSLQGIKVRKKF